MNNITQKKLLVSSRLSVLFTLLILNTVFALALAPLYSRAVSDAGFGFDYLPDILDAAMLVVHLCSFFICYAITAYSIFTFSTEQTVPTILIFSGMTVYKYGLNLVAGWFIFDGIPTTSAEINLSVMSVVSNTMLELFQYAIAILIAYSIIKKVLPAYQLRLKQKEKLGEAATLRDCAFPFTSLLSTKNPLQKSALLIAIWVTAFRIVQLVIYDVFVGGIPSSLPDILWMLAYYLGTVILGALGYLLMLLILMKLDSLDLKLKNKYSA